jgi:hypothetical protein
MSSFVAARTAINLAGYSLVEGDMPTMVCAYEPLEFFSAPDVSSLARYAMNYQFCDCGRH